MLSALGITVVGFDVAPQISDELVNAVTISSYSLSVATTVLSTVIIVTRIMIVSRMPGASRQPQLGIAVEIIVESAALYSISAIVYTPMIADSTLTYNLYGDLFFAHMAVESHPVHTSPSPSANCLSQNFAPALIMLRVVLGRARADNEWSGKIISGLQFKSTPGVQGSTRSRGATSTILTIPTSHRGKEIDLEVNGELRTEPFDREEGMGGVNEERAKI
jgi:hypothetical protein